MQKNRRKSCIHNLKVYASLSTQLILITSKLNNNNQISPLQRDSLKIKNSKRTLEINSTKNRNQTQQLKISKITKLHPKK